MFSKYQFSAFLRLFLQGGVICLCFMIPQITRADEIGSVSTEFKFFGPNHKIIIEAFDDPEVPGVSCHLSRPKTGGITGGLGLAEDKAFGSIACRQVGPIPLSHDDLKDLEEGEKVFKERLSVFFKTMQVVRFYDEDRRVLVYLVYSDKLIDGSYKNAISTVPVMPWRK